MSRTLLEVEVNRPARPTAPTLIGRQAEWATALDALDTVTHGRPGWLAVEGEPGIGKSRLLGELAGVADQRGCLVLTGRGSEFERTIPFGLWVDALDDYVGALGPTRLAGLLGRADPELATVFPALTAWAADRPGGERLPARRAVRALLGALTATRPVLLVLDDVQWADPASVDVLTHLLRRPVSGPLLVAIACRSGHGTGGPPAGFASAVGNVGGSWLVLEPLTRAESGELLAAEGVPTRLRDSVYADGGGNPFYLQQLARVAQRPGRVLSNGRDRPPGVPVGVAAALGQELDALSPAARYLAQGAAVAGEPFAVDHAVAAADLPDDAVPGSLDELLGAGIVGTTDVPQRFRFRHPIVRRAVYHGAPLGWRAGAHGRVAARFPGAAPAIRAHHVEVSARPGDLAAVRVLTDAAELTARSAPEAAVRWYEAALRLLPDGDPQRLALLTRVGMLLVSTGDLFGGRERLLEALTLDPPDDVRVAVVIACAFAESMVGESDAAEQRMLRVLDELADNRSAPAAAVRIQLARDALHRSEVVAGYRWAQAGAEIATEVGDRPLAAQAAALCALLGCMVDPRTADGAVANAARRLDALSIDELDLCLDAPFNLGHAELQRERFEDARRHLRRGADRAEATGHAQFLVPTLTGLAFTLDALGRLGEAKAVSRHAVEVAEAAEVPHQLAWALGFRAAIATSAGDLALATGCAATAVDRLTSADPPILTATVHLLVAATWLAAGRPDRSLAALAEAGRPDFPHIAPAHRCSAHTTAALAELATGGAAAAWPWVHRAERLSAELGLPVAHGAALRAKAAVLLHEGAPAEAAEVALAASESARSRGAGVDAARSAVLAGRALAAAGEVDRAVLTLRAAEATLGAAGARREREEAHALLSGLIEPRRNDGLGALTAREQQVARLVAQGHTNRRLAASLFISEKTVEASLTRIYGKVGVSSRAALAALVARGDAG